MIKSSSLPLRIQIFEEESLAFTIAMTNELPCVLRMRPEVENLIG